MRAYASFVERFWKLDRKSAPGGPNSTYTSKAYKKALKMVLVLKDPSQRLRTQVWKG